MNDVQNRIKRRYKGMVEGENAFTTLWEHFGLVNGTKNHAWTGGPLITMSKNMAGIEPTKPGFDEYKIEPELGNLTHIDCMVHTVKGDIKTDCKECENKFVLTVDTTVDAHAYVVVPKKYVSDDDCFENYNSKKAIKITKGKWNITCSADSNGRIVCEVLKNA